MQFLKYCCGALMTVLAAGCGSGTNAGSSTAYSFVSPKVNSQQIYSQTTVDNSNNTIYQTTRNTVTAINADGSYDLVHDDPSGSSTTVNGTTYSTITESIRENSSGQEIEYMAQPPPTIVGIACTVSPHGAGPNYPLTIGQAWTSNYSVTCGGIPPLSYTQTGSVVSVESVTVPAGTFSALKLQSTLTWTDPKGTIHNEATTTWRDINSAIVVKRVTNTEYSGTPLVNGYPVTSTSALESES